ncbi:MAG TPA: hypothetical protein ENK54_06305 [Thiotrichales bacterium]|nr:hypothetical protein [Thiotrichales bacterium]
MSLPALSRIALLLIFLVPPVSAAGADPFPLLEMRRTAPDDLEGRIEVAGIGFSARGSGEEIRLLITLHGGVRRIEAVMERNKPMSLLEVHVDGSGSGREKRLVDHAALLLLDRQMEGRLDDGSEASRVLLTFVRLLTRRLPIGTPFPATVEVP